MKKKIFSLILVCCFILPCLFMFAACKKEEKGKYDDIVANINNNQTFAKSHIEKLLEDTIKSDFKMVTTMEDETETTVCSYSTKTLYVKNEYVSEDLESEDLESDVTWTCYKEDIYYSIYGTSSTIDVYEYYDKEEEGYEVDVKTQTALIILELIQNCTAKASEDYYEIISEAYEFLGIEIPSITIKVADGKILSISGESEGKPMLCTFQPVSASDLIGLNDIAAGIDSIDLNYVQNATELDLSLFEMIDTIYCYDLDEIVLSDEVETYIADNFLFNEYDEWERVVIAE